MVPVVIVHGGAGDITDARVPGKLVGIKKAVKEGYAALLNNDSALDAVEVAVKSMELDENFNAGYGSVLNTDGNVELEASIMHGEHLKAGCVSLIKEIMHPISVARRVMEKTNHTFLGGPNAMRFIRSEGFEVLPDGSLVTENARTALADFKDKQKMGLDTRFARTELDKREDIGPKEPGTVGAVAIDSKGNIAVATSTGGITGKIPGRIGDTPVLGSGTYADNQVGGVSTTGHGETIMRFNLAQRILQNMLYQKTTAQVATETSCKEMTERLQGTGGAITVDKKGDVGIYFTSKRMAWAYTRGKEVYFGIDAKTQFTEKL